MKIYGFRVPITAVANIEIEANSEEEAREKIFDEITLRHVEEWEPLQRVNQGNVCYAMQPWSIELDYVSEE